MSIKSQKNIHIKNGRVIDPSQQLDLQGGDVFIKDGRIVSGFSGGE